MREGRRKGMREGGGRGGREGGGRKGGGRGRIEERGIRKRQLKEVLDNFFK